jgi:hypothetical protein
MFLFTQKLLIYCQKEGMLVCKHTSQLAVEWQLQAGHRSPKDLSSDGF